MAVRRKHSEEFKRDAVALSYHSDKPIKEIAADLGIHRSLLVRWRHEMDDLGVIHDTGAHGYAMGFNYNGKLRSAELLLRENRSVQLIRRAETIDDYFATMRFPEAPINV